MLILCSFFLYLQGSWKLPTLNTFVRKNWLETLKKSKEDTNEFFVKYFLSYNIFLSQSQNVQLLWCQVSEVISRWLKIFGLTRKIDSLSRKCVRRSLFFWAQTVLMHIVEVWAWLGCTSRMAMKWKMGNVLCLYLGWCLPHLAVRSEAHLVWYHQKRTALFWAITQRVVLIPYRRFGTTYRAHLEGSRIKVIFDPSRWDR
jgi:hypothetical protein